MDVSIIGGREITLPQGWQRQTLVLVVGGAEIDARAKPGQGATLTIVTIFGGVDLKVPAGAKISVAGFSLLGGRHVEITPGDGPEIAVRVFTVFGGVQITDKE